VRECQVYSEIVRHDIAAPEVAKMAPKGIILSGGPASVYEKSAPQIDLQIFSLGIPGPGHLLRDATHGATPERRSGIQRPARVWLGPAPSINNTPLLDVWANRMDIWNSHGDS
jgi:GMP synthase (glutamine-hydrolysing)